MGASDGGATWPVDGQNQGKRRIGLGVVLEPQPGLRCVVQAWRHHVPCCTPAPSHFATFNAIYDRYFAGDNPARIFVQVPSWPGPFDVEIDCVRYSGASATGVVSW